MRLNKKIVQKLLDNFGGEKYVKSLKDGMTTRAYEIVFDVDDCGNYLNSANLFVYKVKRLGKELYYNKIKKYKITDIERDVWGKVISYKIEEVSNE